MKLADCGEDLAYDIAFSWLGLQNPEGRLEQLGNLSMELSYKFRALAILTLVVKADADLFHHNLIRSALAREIYLRRLAARGIQQDHHRAIGRYDPLLDAIAAGDLPRARRIVDLSPREWQEGHEYEDDFCYARIVAALLSDRPREEELLPVMERLERWQDGERSARLDVCRALTLQNREMFDGAFADLLAEREARIAADIERAQLETPEVIAHRLVFVEGLAVLRLAEIRGIEVEPEYRFCPSLARRPMRRPFPGE